MQTSESFRLSAILSFSGGLQDAYTYNVRAGNVVLLSQNIMMGNWHNGMHYILPLLSFAAGVLLTEQIEYRYKKSRIFHWRQLILLIEIVLLGIVGFLPVGLNVIANMMVSFTCAMQVQAFRKVHGYGYASTMCIGNLRSGTESLSQYLRSKDRAFLLKALHYFGIILFFALGAGAGGILSDLFSIRAIWASPLLLTAVTGMMIKKTR